MSRRGNNFVYLLRQTGMTRGNLSVRMSRLESAGAVRATKREVDGRLRTTYALSREGLEALRADKSTMRTILDAIPD